MRGFAALAAALFAVALLNSLLFLDYAEARSFEAEQAALKIANLDSVEADFRSSLAMVLSKGWSEGQSAEEKVEAVAEKLAEWEKLIEDNYAERGVVVDVWWGNLDELEKTRLPEKMLEERRALKCSFCADFSEKLEGRRGEPVWAGAAALEEIEGKIVVSGSARLQPEKFSGRNPAGGFGIGCSVFMPKERLAAVFLAGGGD